MDGFKGRTVQVREAAFNGKDKFGNPVREHGEAKEVQDVLIAPGDGTDRIEDGSPYGAEVALTLYVPKGQDVEWRGALVSIGSREYKVAGEPEGYPEEIVATGRNLMVKVVRYDGF